MKSLETIKKASKLFVIAILFGGQLAHAEKIYAVCGKYPLEIILEQKDQGGVVHMKPMGKIERSYDAVLIQKNENTYDFMPWVKEGDENGQFYLLQLQVLSKTKGMIHFLDFKTEKKIPELKSGECVLK